MSLRIKKRTNGSYDLGENVRVPGKKTPRFKAILHLGKNPTIDAAIEAQKRDRCDPRRSGESQIEAESRRAKAKLIIERLQTMKMRAENEAVMLAREMVNKVVLQKMQADPRTAGIAEQARKRIEREAQEEQDRITRAQLEQAASVVEQATRHLKPPVAAVSSAAERKHGLVDSLAANKRLIEQAEQDCNRAREVELYKIRVGLMEELAREFPPSTDNRYA
jgi:hypothetical protein